VGEVLALLERNGIARYTLVRMNSSRFDRLPAGGVDAGIRRAVRLGATLGLWCLSVFLPVFGLAASKSGEFSGVPAAVQPYVDRGEIAGAVSLVADKNKVLHLSAVGISDLATGRKQTTDDLFWIASMTKPIAAVAVALLVDEGKVSWDDPLEKFLPEFRGQWLLQEADANRRILVPSARPITLRDVLTHTSGLGEYPVAAPHWSLAEMTKIVAREPLRFPPGSRWGYSTAGIDAVGRIVEVVSGQEFADFLKQRLLQPLGMKDTTWWTTASQEARRARTYRRDAVADRLVETPIRYLYGGAVTDRARPPLGGAGLFSTAADIARFYQMMLHRGTANGRRILKPETVEELTRKQTGDLRARPGMSWGLGFCVIDDPAQMEANRHFRPGTFGHGGAFGTQSWADPATGLVYVFLIQRDGIPGNPDNSPMRRAYQDAVAAAIVRP
jgi:CubicO group peptidase (beta-lactamase class C family)